MRQPLAKTSDEHIVFCCEMARLMLWFAGDCIKKNPRESLVHILQDKTCIWRFVAPAAKYADASPEWPAILKSLLTCHAESLASPDIASFEDAGFAIIRDALEAQAKATYGGKSSQPNGELGALTYDPPLPDKPQRIAFHIGNPLQPRSIFDDPDYLPRCLYALMNDAEAKFGVTELFTGTWLNSYPPFLKSFPKAYADSTVTLREPFTSRGYGTWGQFVNARGCFNHKHGNLFRRNGVLPFCPIRASCSFEDLRNHLDMKR